MSESSNFICCYCNQEIRDVEKIYKVRIPRARFPICLMHNSPCGDVFRRGLRSSHFINYIEACMGDNTEVEAIEEKKRATKLTVLTPENLAITDAVLAELASEINEGIFRGVDVNKEWVYLRASLLARENPIIKAADQIRSYLKFKDGADLYKKPIESPRVDAYTYPQPRYFNWYDAAPNLPGQEKPKESKSCSFCHTDKDVQDNGFCSRCRPAYARQNINCAIKLDPHLLLQRDMSRLSWIDLHKVHALPAYNEPIYFRFGPGYMKEKVLTVGVYTENKEWITHIPEHKKLLDGMPIHDWAMVKL